jgi:hypothetical protein
MSRQNRLYFELAAYIGMCLLYVLGPESKREAALVGVGCMVLYSIATRLVDRWSRSKE